MPGNIITDDIEKFIFRKDLGEMNFLSHVDPKKWNYKMVIGYVGTVTKAEQKIEEDFNQVRLTIKINPQDATAMHMYSWPSSCNTTPVNRNFLVQTSAFVHLRIPRKSTLKFMQTKVPQARSR
jgi:hypothetical protein